MRPGIIADDLTGACDSAARAAQAGWHPRVVLSCSAEESDPVAKDVDLLVISTATRNRSPKQAAAVVAEAARAMIACGARPCFKKIDSTLRGPWAAEVAALRRMAEAELVAVAPAFPDCGRVVRGGVVFCDGKRVGALAPALAAAGIRDVIIGDAESDEQLAAFVKSVKARGRRILWVGSGGLARFAFGPGGNVAPALQPAAARWLIIAGSKHPVTLAQMEAVRQASLESQAPRVEVVLEVPERIKPGTGLFLIGGDTAARAVRALGARALDVFGEALPGVAIGRLVGGCAAGAPFLSKAGGFGAPDTVLRAVRLCTACETKQLFSGHL